jgi:hypothetical protein
MFEVLEVEHDYFAPWITTAGERHDSLYLP